MSGLRVKGKLKGTRMKTFMGLNLYEWTLCVLAISYLVYKREMLVQIGQMIRFT